MHIERFNRLIEVMRNQAVKAAAAGKGGPHLDMSTWLSDEIPPEQINGPLNPDLAVTVRAHGWVEGGVYLKHGFCGSVACMAGYGAMDEQLNTQGLKIALLGIGRNPMVAFEGSLGHAGLAKFFDIPGTHAEMLFGDNYAEQELRQEFGFDDSFEGAAAFLQAYVDGPEYMFSQYNGGDDRDD